MRVIVWSVISPVFVSVPGIGPVRVFMLVPVVMFVSMHVGVFVGMGFAAMLMLMRMIVSVFMNVLMFVFVGAFHRPFLLCSRFRNLGLP